MCVMDILSDIYGNWICESPDYGIDSYRDISVEAKFQMRSTPHSF